ncbi:endonuclease/exonuclease/phosphatase family protein [Streptomyces sp. C10-9-1]|uniref:endonuclease/exonuclease/phosphatase family protein n=1 Tax=Streptomyces sp. C10-9-1 TaxID=1859285 RepID=UPI00211231F8|nr:endonuclease/exonuclease/phosphatase family protein [Streptomyces sp. C10-9-1]MCQ6554358.1 endonuclease/exonuclease/phosphatase family protein [Streptomyces sp. C10-9-1]
MPRPPGPAVLGARPSARPAGEVPPVPRRRRRTGLRVLVAASVVWGVFTVLGHLLSGRWWPWLLADLTPPPLFAAVPLVLLALCLLPLARGARSRLVPLLVVVLLAGVPRAGLHWGALVPGGGPDPAPPGALKVFSWNTLYWDTTDDPGAFYRFLASRDADVYLLQEYLAWRDGEPAPVDRLARLRAEFPGYRVVVLGELVTLSRRPVVAVPPVGRARELTPRSGWAERFERGKVLRTDIDVGGTVVSFYNVHVPVQLDVHRSVLSGGFYRVVRDRDAQRREHYEALLEDARANRNPVLISGDFNTTPAMGDLRGLRSAFRDALPASSGLLPGTWDADGPALWRLDWTFTGGRLAVHRYAFVPPEGLSDHRGQELLVSSADGAPDG